MEARAQSQVSENLSKSQQDHSTIVGDGHKTIQKHLEFSGREWSAIATGLTLGVTGVKHNLIRLTPKHSLCTSDILHVTDYYGVFQ